jgi:hypothetical protein
VHLYHASVYVSNFGKQLGAYAHLSEGERVKYDEGITHVLESYHYIQKENYLRQAKADGKRFFCDSGAFSAFSMGVTIDIDKFCDYCHENADAILMMSVLDAIGDPDGTWRNQMYMESRGLRPLPCYHFGEPVEILEWYIKTYPYITIGGMVPISTPQLLTWLDRIWGEHLTDGDGKPRCKVHGFGLTSPDLMNRYPWYSVDSSTWQALGSNGSIVLPPHGKTLAISSNAAQRKIPGQHLDTLRPPERQAVIEMIEGYGFDVELLRAHHSHRWTWNVWQMPRIANARGHRETFRTVEQRLF